MKKPLRLCAVVLALTLCAVAFTGCSYSLEGYPDGTRPQTLSSRDLLPTFAPENAVGVLLNEKTSIVEKATDMDSQRLAYQDFLKTANIYIMGAYSAANFITADGGSIDLYYEDMGKQLNNLVNTFEPYAWAAIQDAEWGKELAAEFSKGATTVEKLRNAYPTTTKTGAVMTQAVYDARERYDAALSADNDEAALCETLRTILSLDADIASQAGYDSFPAYYFLRRDNLPYTQEDMLKLCALVKENLAPVYTQTDALPAKTAEEWQAALPALIECFPTYKEDLSYCLQNGLLTVQPVKEGGTSEHYAAMLYHYDAAYGRARVDGTSADLYNVLALLGEMARDMAIPSQEWGIGTAMTANAVQSRSFTALCTTQLDALYPENAAQAQAVLKSTLLESALRHAMEYEILYALHTTPTEQITPEWIAAQAQVLSEGYGLAFTARDVYELQDLLLSNVSAAPELLGDLAGLQVYVLAQEDPTAAQTVVDAMFTVYNYGSPVVQAINAGLPNPFSAQSLAAAAQKLAAK